MKKVSFALKDFAFFVICILIGLNSKTAVEYAAAVFVCLGRLENLVRLGCCFVVSLRSLNALNSLVYLLLVHRCEELLVVAGEVHLLLQ